MSWSSWCRCCCFTNALVQLCIQGQILNEMVDPKYVNSSTTSGIWSQREMLGVRMLVVSVLNTSLATVIVRKSLLWLFFLVGKPRCALWQIRLGFPLDTGNGYFPVIFQSLRSPLLFPSITGVESWCRWCSRMVLYCPSCFDPLWGIYHHCHGLYGWLVIQSPFPVLQFITQWIICMQFLHNCMVECCYSQQRVECSDGAEVQLCAACAEQSVVHHF